MKLVTPSFSDIMEPNITIKRFPDGDNYIKLPDVIDSKQVILFHRLWPEQDSALVQAFLILSTLKKAGVKTTVVFPYLPYSRQDKIFKEGETLSAEEICRLLDYAGAERLVTFDCHFLKKEGEFGYGGLKIANISMAEKLIAHAKALVNGEPLEIISPDVGTHYMVEQHCGNSMKKVRGQYRSGTEAYREIESMEGSFEVKDKNVLIIDDIIGAGGTMLRAVENLKKNGAKRILCAATHGLFLKDSMIKLQEACNSVFVSDSVNTSLSQVKIAEILKKKGYL